MTNRLVPVLSLMMACSAAADPDDSGQDSVDGEPISSVAARILAATGTADPAAWAAECDGGPYDVATAVLLADDAGAETWLAEEGYDPTVHPASSFDAQLERLVGVQLRCSTGSPANYGLHLSEEVEGEVVIDIRSNPEITTDTGNVAWTVAIPAKYTSLGAVTYTAGSYPE